MDAQYFVLLMRDGEVCHICGQGRADADPFEVEHIVPKLRGRKGGGGDDLANLAIAHRSCNRTKQTKAISQPRPEAP